MEHAQGARKGLRERERWSGPAGRDSERCSSNSAALRRRRRRRRTVCVRYERSSLSGLWLLQGCSKRRRRTVCVRFERSSLSGLWLLPGWSRRRRRRTVCVRSERSSLSGLWLLPGWSRRRRRRTVCVRSERSSLSGDSCRDGLRAGGGGGGHLDLDVGVLWQVAEPDRRRQTENALVHLLPSFPFFFFLHFSVKMSPGLECVRHWSLCCTLSQSYNFRVTC
jgi:hypothetical protein